MNIVDTPLCGQVTAAVASLSGSRECVAVWGPTGTGNAARQAYPNAVVINAAPLSLANELLGEIAVALELPFRDRSPRYATLREVRRTLTEERRLLVIDGAGKLSAEALGMAFHLLEVPEASVDLLLVVTSTQKPFSRKEDSGGRVGRWVEAMPLADADVLNVVPPMDDLLANPADDDLLIEINTALRGRMRGWRHFLGHARELDRRSGGDGVLSVRIASMALARMGVIS